VIFDDTNDVDVIEYILSNSGKSPATLVLHKAVEAWTGIDRPLPRTPAFRPVTTIPLGTKMLPGHPQRCTHACDGDVMARQMIIAGDVTVDWFFYTKLAFEDENGSRTEGHSHIQVRSRSARFHSGTATDG
jgi:hypothetical protein